MSKVIQSKRFVVRQSLIGTETTIEVTFKSGSVIKYDHDKAFTIMKDKLESLACFIKYKSYTASNNIPVVLRGTEAVISQTLKEVVKETK